MDQRTKELVAMGAAAAVNCRPCMEHHLPLCQDAGASPEDIGKAVETGLQVGRGAAVKTREYVNALLSTEHIPAVKAAGCC